VGETSHRDLFILFRAAAVTASGASAAARAAARAARGAADAFFTVFFSLYYIGCGASDYKQNYCDYYKINRFHSLF
jgi:hypothetical protein